MTCTPRGSTSAIPPSMATSSSMTTASRISTSAATVSQDGYSFGIMYGVALADDLSKPVGEPVKLMEADQPWEKVRYAENRCNEGAFVLKHDGRYYMTYSANHTGFPALRHRLRHGGQAARPMDEGRREPHCGDESRHRCVRAGA